MTVTGNKMKITLEEAGISRVGTKIFPVGNPAYDGFLSYAADFNEKRKKDFKESMGLTRDKDLYALFLHLISIPIKLKKLQSQVYSEV